VLIKVNTFMKKITISGNKIGCLNNPKIGIKEVSIIHIVNEFRPQGPAENSIIRVIVETNGFKQASYIPWVGYFDLDRESFKFPKRWKIIEPSKKVSYQNLNWEPFIKSPQPLP